MISHFLSSITSSLLDNFLYDTVTPIPGSFLYCDLALNMLEHSGIYIGNGKIAHLDGDGEVKSSNPIQFLNRLNGLNTALTIYVSCKGGNAVGSEMAADIAKQKIGTTRNYNLILDNCHQFSSGCLSANFENPNNFLIFAKHEAEKILGADNWRAWTRSNGAHTT